MNKELSRKAIRNSKAAALKERYGNPNNQNVINEEMQKDYLTRLKNRYSKNGVKKCFYDQYIRAPGHELGMDPEIKLDGSFWSPRSSSRFAFEAYSWLADQNFCKDIEVEYMLPKILNGNGISNPRTIPPTMDIFFYTDSDIYFIESKFLEFVNVKMSFQNLSISYYEESRPGLLLARYHRNERISDCLPRFVENIKSFLEKTGTDIDDYFDPKQEITHLVGIALWLNDNPSILNEIQTGNKKIHFYNTVYKFDEKDDKKAIEFRRFFLKDAKETFWDMFNIELDYEIKYTQEFVGELLKFSNKRTKTKSFASNATVLQQLGQFD